jgi:DNA-binding MarR family transcriptional regulator
MTSCQQDAAQEVLSIVPHVMRTVSAELRRSGYAIMPGHYHVMTMLARERYSLSEIAERQLVSLPTTSRSISTLVERGWVVRVRDPGDRRIIRLALTDEGQAVLAAIHKVAADAMTSQLEGLTNQDCENLVRGLAILHRVFSQPDLPPRERRQVLSPYARSIEE